MGEAISHICGTCGESHPHLLNLSAIGTTALVMFGGYISYITQKIKLLWKKD